MKTLEPLNYCRQVVKAFTTALEIPSLPDVMRARMNHVLDLCAMSQKFILPDEGILVWDPEFRALLDAPKLVLPYKFIALEFSVNDTHAPVRRHVMFVRERDEVVHLSVARFAQHIGNWTWLPECAISVNDYLKVNQSTGAIELVFRPLAPDAQDPQLYHNYLDVLMSFINTLQCSNVHIERNGSRDKARKAKAALPFDTYHVLTLDVVESPYTNAANQAPGLGTHRSPREHLRRGHIVRPGLGRPYFRRPTMVNAGRGFGKVDKDYRLRNRTTANSNHVPTTQEQPPCP